MNEIESINSVKKPEVKGTDDEIQEKNIDSQNLNKEVDLKQSAEIHSKESHGDLEDDIEGEWIFYKKNKISWAWWNII